METKNQIWDNLYIMGFGLNYKSEKPELYTLVIDEDFERMVTHEDTLLFVTDLSKINVLYSFLDAETKAKYPIPQNLEQTVDVASTLYLLENGEEDENCAILECLNAIFDLWKSIDQKIPDDRKKVLYGLADQLTFSNEFVNYLKASGESRESAIDSLTWALGQLMTRSRII